MENITFWMRYCTIKYVVGILLGMYRCTYLLVVTVVSYVQYRTYSFYLHACGYRSILRTVSYVLLLPTVTVLQCIIRPKIACLPRSPQNARCNKGTIPAKFYNTACRTFWETRSYVVLACKQNSLVPSAPSAKPLNAPCYHLTF